MIRHDLLIAGKPRSTSHTVEVKFPYNDEIVAEVGRAGEEDIEDAIEGAVRGFETTRRMPTHERTSILEALLHQMQKREDELVEALVLEGGKPQNVARGEVGRAQETIRISAEEAKRIRGELIPIDQIAAGEGRQGYVRRMPLGPVLGIAPFNYPLNLACHKLGPAIAAGNSFILKPASATPLSGILLGQMTLAAGFPPEALSVVVAPGALAESMVSDPRIAFCTFTGSSDVGWHLKKVSGRKRIGLELGGNAAAIVHEDANVDYAISRIVMGAYANTGQNCISVQRVLVHQPIYERVLKRLIEEAKNVPFGDPRDERNLVGPMIDANAAAETMGKVREAIDGGARAPVGGACQGNVVAPTLLVDTTSSMRVNREELFAPVMTVAPYSTFDDAIAMANDTDFGLQAGLFTQNINRIHRAFDDIEVGGLMVNDVSTFRIDAMPYGGVKGSGLGREGPRYAIEQMTDPKLMVLNLPGGVA